MTHNMSNYVPKRQNIDKIPYKSAPACGGSGSKAAEGGKVLRGTKEKWNVRAQVELLN